MLGAIKNLTCLNGLLFEKTYKYDNPGCECRESSDHSYILRLNNVITSFMRKQDNVSMRFIFYINWTITGKVESLIMVKNFRSKFCIKPYP